MSEKSVHPRDYRTNKLRNHPQQKKSGDIMLMTYDNKTPPATTVIRDIDLDHLALWCMLPERLHPVLTTLRHDRPEHCNLFDWVTGGIVPVQGQFDKWREMAQARAHHKRGTTELQPFTERIRELGNLDLTTCTWDQLVGTGILMYRASFFLLHTREHCDHVVLDSQMITWVNENLPVRERYVSDIGKNGIDTPAEYSVAEYHARRTMKAAFPFVNGRTADAMVRASGRVA